MAGKAKFGWYEKSPQMNKKKWAGWTDASKYTPEKLREIRTVSDEDSKRYNFKGELRR